MLVRIRALHIILVLSTLSVCSPALVAQDDPPEKVVQELPVEHPECIFFGSDRVKFSPTKLGARSALTATVVGLLGVQQTSSVPPPPGLPFIPNGSRTDMQQKVAQTGTIDPLIFTALQQAGASPAPRTTDSEFIRRVTLDLTGRIPDPTRVVTFLNDPAPDKRAKLVEELLARPEWTDRWTMYFGDLYKNSRITAQTNRYAQSRNAFYQWIKDSLAANKPYNQMATELITAKSNDSTLAESSFTKGTISWLVGGVLTGGVPFQDTVDQQAVNVSQTFLGIAYMNCLLCHNGAGHLDAISLWGKNGTRYQAWQFASFMSRTGSNQNPYTINGTNFPYYTLNTYTGNTPANTRAITTDYTLNTTTGNRPSRQPATPTSPRTVAPVYWFNGHTPANGEDYRIALAREVTGDFQFARAIVNYIWKEFMGLGFVDPPDQFDPMRLDPDNPPANPGQLAALQPSNPRLLNALAQDFINSGFDLKALMRQIVNSNTYQLSSRYNGTWNDSWERLFARKLVRRLTAEEIHDGIVQSSNVIPSYTVTQDTVTFGPVSYAMQLPETSNTGGGATAFLDAFLRGNRIDVERSDESSAVQALDLMNDNFVMTRIRSSGSGATASLLNKNLSLADDQLVTNVFLAILSRYPSTGERAQALANLAIATSGTRQQRAENLIWTLYNKVDFIFNY